VGGGREKPHEAAGQEQERGGKPSERRGTKGQERKRAWNERYGTAADASEAAEKIIKGKLAYPAEARFSFFAVRNL
jgi:hypothetical protein